MTATEYIVLVDEQDQEIGVLEKIAAHQAGLLHRAFSVFIFRDNNGLELLLQKRALEKYHSAGLWTNTCCSHPQQNESIISAGVRRLYEEFGFGAELINIGWFHYTAHFENGLSENEIDHVLIGKVSKDITIRPNPSEIQAYRWVALDQLKQELLENPSQFTPWFSEALQLVLNHLQNSLSFI